MMMAFPGSIFWNRVCISPKLYNEAKTSLLLVKNVINDAKYFSID